MGELCNGWGCYTVGLARIRAGSFYGVPVEHPESTNMSCVSEERSLSCWISIHLYCKENTVTARDTVQTSYADGNTKATADSIFEYSTSHSTVTAGIFLKITLAEDEVETRKAFDRAKPGRFDVGFRFFSRTDGALCLSSGSTLKSSGRVSSISGLRHHFPSSSPAHGSSAIHACHFRKTLTAFASVTWNHSVCVLACGQVLRGVVFRLLMSSMCMSLSMRATCGTRTRSPDEYCKRYGRSVESRT